MGRFVSAIIAAMLITAAAAATPALASEWLVNAAVISGTWTRDITGELLFEDSHQKIDVLCEEITGLGTITAPKAGTLSELKCGKTESMTAGITCTKGVVENLPWNTELDAARKEIISEGGSGPLKFKFECTIIGVKVIDTCTETEVQDTVENQTEGFVSDEFTGSSEEVAECSLDGKVALKIEGRLASRALSSLGFEQTLAIN